MDEKKIKELFRIMIEKLILRKFPYLSLHSLQGPSESVNPWATVFYVVFVSDKDLTSDEVIKIKSNTTNLFKSAGLNSYKIRDFYYGVKIDVADAATGDIYK